MPDKSIDRTARLDGLSIRDLRALVLLADRRQFATAAREFGISQPTLTSIVKKAESSFGAPLFVRTPRRFAVTAEGDAILREIRVLTEQIAHLTAITDPESSPLTGLFRLGVIPTLSPYYVPSILPRLCEQFPHLQLVVREEKTAALMDRLRKRDIDAALVSIPVDAPEFATLPLFYEPLVVGVPIDNALAVRTTVRVTDIQPSELVLLEEGNCLRDQVLATCGVPRRSPAQPLPATSLETMRYMVASRMGIGIFPYLAVGPDAPVLPIRYIPFERPAPARVIALLTRRQGKSSTEARHLHAFLRSHLPADVRIASK